MSERREHELDLFYEALSKADPAVRTAFLEQACASQCALRERLEKLLAAHAEAERFFVQEESASLSYADARQEQ